MFSICCVENDSLPSLCDSSTRQAQTSLAMLDSFRAHGKYEALKNTDIELLKDEWIILGRKLRKCVFEEKYACW